MSSVSYTLMPQQFTLPVANSVTSTTHFGSTASTTMPMMMPTMPAANSMQSAVMGIPMTAQTQQFNSPMFPTTQFAGGFPSPTTATAAGWPMAGQGYSFASYDAAYKPQGSVMPSGYGVGYGYADVKPSAMSPMMMAQQQQVYNIGVPLQQQFGGAKNFSQAYQSHAPPVSGVPVGQYQNIAQPPQCPASPTGRPACRQVYQNGEVQKKGKGKRNAETAAVVGGVALLAVASALLFPVSLIALPIAAAAAAC